LPVEKKRAALVSWLSEHLTHKVVVFIVAVGLITWVVLAVILLSRTDEVVRAAYASTLSGTAAEAAIEGFHQWMFVNITVFSACMFVVLAVVVYLVGLAPIIHLRQAMEDYGETGSRPMRTGRRDEVGQLQNAFADMVDTLERKEQAERRLIASISHDIKTPLTSVLGYAQRLSAAELTAEKREQYQQLVYDRALRIKAVVDEFDEYLDAGLRAGSPMAPVTAGALCERLREEYAAEVRDAGVAFTVECRCPDAPLLCSWEHMRRLFGNLIGNAFSHAGAEHLELTLLCRQEGERAVFLFRDNGRGVPRELREQIFEPLYTTDRGRKVSGLGLSICKTIAKAHGGTIGAEDAPGGGLEIRLVLPLAEG